MLYVFFKISLIKDAFERCCLEAQKLFQLFIHNFAQYGEVIHSSFFYLVDKTINYYILF